MKSHQPGQIPSGRRKLNTHRISKKYSFTLPLSLASRLNALREMNPEKSQTQLITHLLGLGLAELERAWSGCADDAALQPDTTHPIYLLSGPFAEFHKLIHKHHLALETALAGKESADPAAVDPYSLEGE